ncbi:MAG: hypothetical protein FWG50_05860 [Kiritimatiellaeota bacterium]|nr:hypothetical protein [Kiritimatiellota bacterium]
MAILNEIPPPETFRDFGEQGAFHAWMKYAVIVAALVCVLGVAACFLLERRAKPKPDKEEEAKTEEPQPSAAAPDLHSPVRDAPAAFPVDSNLPRGRETLASGPIDLATFSEKKDIVRFEDKRVWFDSDNKKDPEEDDHLIHRAMEVPLKRLVNLLEKKSAKAKLKVHDAYRPTGIHLEKSLHREGRAIDLTCEGISLSELAKLAWQSGFDFVLYEKPGASGGEHLHCSVKRTPDAPPPERPAN